MTDLARALLDEIAADPVALDRLRELVDAARDDQRDDVDRGAVLRVPALLTVTGTAQLLGVSTKTVRRRIAERALPAVVEHGRTMVRGDELRAYVEALDRPGGPAPSRRRSPSSAGRFDFLREQGGNEC